MNNYYVNTAPFSGQNHEVHKEGCTYMPTNKKHLGLFSSCQGAVTKAKETYPDADGCYYCCNACHTK